MTHTGLLHMFRLQMDRRHYSQIFIWDSIENMWAANPEMGKKKYYGLATAKVVSATLTSKIHIPHKFGEIHLCQNGYSLGVVAHEIMHLLGYWIRCKGWDLDKHDEKIARLNGNLNYGFWKEHAKWWKVSDI